MKETYKRLCLFQLWFSAVQILSYDVVNATLTQCQEKIKMDQNLVQNYMNGKTLLPLDDANLKEYLECLDLTRNVIVKEKLKLGIKRFLLPLMEKRNNSKGFVNKSLKECDGFNDQAQPIFFVELNYLLTAVLENVLFYNTCGLYVFIPTLSEILDHSDDFYWRDYNGIVPKDALPGGMDRERKPTYIGQAVSSGTLVPGEIISGVKKLYYFGDYNPQVELENIKILCTKNPDNFEWIQANTGTVKSMRRMRLIPCGVAPGQEIYIGRGMSDNMMSVGKVVIPDGSRNAYFKTVVNGKSYSPNDFEVLGYRLSNVDILDSYWRELHGDIPIDALPSGLTSLNSVTYVGEVVYSYTLWFGNINSDGIINIFLYGQVVSESSNIKILCTKHPERFSWRKIASELDFRQVDKNRLVSNICGVGECYVARAHYHNHVVVGTLSSEYEYDNKLRFKGATDVSGFETNTFEVLYYTPQENANSSTRQQKSVILILVLIIYKIYSNILH
ncbi:hypothetical protein FQR65_LT03302 [Abscondita terminalis]|nr:hypothetical protein FQR65_LT03302 [Abscondita terminalis]